MSNNDRIEAVTQAIHRVRCCDRTDEQSVRYYRDYAEIAVAALDAYDREHPSPEVERLRAEAKSFTDVTCACGHPRTSHTPLDFGDCSECPHGTCAKYPGLRWDIWHRGTLRERDEARAELADLRERIATEVKDGCPHTNRGGLNGCSECWATADRIARGGA